MFKILVVLLWAMLITLVKSSFGGFIIVVCLFMMVVRTDRLFNGHGFAHSSRRRVLTEVCQVFGVKMSHLTFIRQTCIAIWIICVGHVFVAVALSDQPTTGVVSDIVEAFQGIVISATIYYSNTLTVFKKAVIAASPSKPRG